MNEIHRVNEWINELVEFLNHLYGLPGIALVALMCLLGGYFLKSQHWFPNQGIPTALVILGAALLPLISDFRDSPLPLRVWLVRNLVVGALVGLGTWAFHRLILKRIEDKIPWLGQFLRDTETKKNNGAAVNPPAEIKP